MKQCSHGQVPATLAVCIDRSYIDQVSVVWITCRPELRHMKKIMTERCSAL